MPIAEMIPRAEERDDCVILQDIPWETYERLSRDLDRQNVRMAYDDGILEIMSPSRKHEHAKEWLGTMIRVLAEEYDVDFSAGGSTRLRRRKLKKGLEPDQCFWLSNARRVIGRKEIKLPKDPPPDLAIEIDVTSSSLKRMGIYAALRVSEVWRYDGERLRVYRLASGAYRPASRSLSFPSFPLSHLEDMLERHDKLTEFQMMKAFRRIVRDQLAK
jgi:Uma2 family endonuclease